MRNLLYRIGLWLVQKFGPLPDDVKPPYAQSSASIVLPAAETESAAPPHIMHGAARVMLVTVISDLPHASDASKIDRTRKMLMRSYPGATPEQIDDAIRHACVV